MCFTSDHDDIKTFNLNNHSCQTKIGKIPLVLFYTIVLTCMMQSEAGTDDRGNSQPPVHTQPKTPRHMSESLNQFLPSQQIEIIPKLRLDFLRKCRNLRRPPQSKFQATQFFGPWIYFTWNCYQWSCQWHSPACRKIEIWEPTWNSSSSNWFTKI